MVSVRDPSPSLCTVDDLIQKLAREEAEDSPPLIAFPRLAKEGPGGDYDYFTGRDLDRLVEGAAQEYLARGLSLGVRSTATVARSSPRPPEYTSLWLTVSRADETAGEPGCGSDREVHVYFLHLHAWPQSPGLCGASSVPPARCSGIRLAAGEDAVSDYRAHGRVSCHCAEDPGAP